MTDNQLSFGFDEPEHHEHRANEDWFLACAIGAVLNAWDLYVGYAERLGSDNEVDGKEYSRVWEITHAPHKVNAAYFVYNQNDETIMTIRYGFDLPQVWYKVEDGPVRFMEVHNVHWSYPAMQKLVVSNQIVRTVYGNQIVSYRDIEVAEPLIESHDGLKFLYEAQISQIY